MRGGKTYGRPSLRGRPDETGRSGGGPESGGNVSPRWAGKGSGQRAQQAYTSLAGFVRRPRLAYTICTQASKETSHGGATDPGGMREFREDLAEYLGSPAPVAITRHGRTVGYYIPADGMLDEQEVLALRRAVEQIEALLAEKGISEEQVVHEFRARRGRS